MTALLASLALHARARAFVDAFAEGRAMPEPFDALACDLARFQAAHVPGYAKLIAHRGLDPARFERHLDPPSVPTDAFKLTRVSAFEPEATPIVFRTSGTTIGERGSHWFRDASTYDAAALAFARYWLFHQMPARTRVLVVGPAPSEAPDSSLTHMLALFARSFGGAKGERAFFLEGDVFDLVALDDAVASATVEDVPVVLLGTSFAFVHFLDALGQDRFRLPAGSRLMQTGGFKGKSREVSAPALRRALSEMFSVPDGGIVGEYGMTELSSQCYEGTLHGGAAGVYVEPPWMRVTPVDPETLEPTADGEVGIARITDLANVDSAAFVLAADRVRRVPCSAAPSGTGFELLGRLPGAPPRGCSIALDEILGRHDGAS